MKVPPKRKGNFLLFACGLILVTLNESPSEKEGKSRISAVDRSFSDALNESPSEKEGKCGLVGVMPGAHDPQ